MKYTLEKKGGNETRGSTSEYQMFQVGDTLYVISAIEKDKGKLKIPLEDLRVPNLTDFDSMKKEIATRASNFFCSADLEISYGENEFDTITDIVLKNMIDFNN